MESPLRDAAILAQDENAGSSPVGVISRDPSTSLIFQSQIGFFIGFVPNPTPLVGGDHRNPIVAQVAPDRNQAAPITRTCALPTIFFEVRHSRTMSEIDLSSLMA